MGYALLERKSNLIFFDDELDKYLEHFYSAFYTLFDNVLYKDTNYDVDVSGTLIVITSNYHTEEMKKNLGFPIFIVSINLYILMIFGVTQFILLL